MCRRAKPRPIPERNMNRGQCVKGRVQNNKSSRANTQRSAGESNMLIQTKQAAGCNLSSQ